MTRKMRVNKDLVGEWVPIGDLTPWDRNPRDNDHAVQSVADSIKRFGWGSVIVARKSDGVVIAGHTRLKAAQKLGMDKVPVRYLDLDPAEAAAMALADNKLGELADWESDVLAEVLQGLEGEGVDLAGLGFSDDELSALLSGPEALPGSEGEDDVPDVQEEADSVLGGVYELGPHRLVCGDSTTVEAFDLAGASESGAVITDPPYGMNLDTEYAKIGAGTAKGDVAKGKDYRRVIGDDKPFDAAPLIAMLDHVQEQFWWGADYYRRTIPDGGSWLVWDKRVPGLEAAVGNAFELCWSRGKHKRNVLRYLWSGFTAKERGEARCHPTQKPVAMIVEIIEGWVSPGVAVFDPFAGSGTTLVACAQTGRRARLIELDPRYCDVIRRRWTRYAAKHDLDAGSGALED